MVYGKSETGLWDNLPALLRQAIFLSYPILLLMSLLFFIYYRKQKSPKDKLTITLFLLNGISIILLFRYSYS